MLSSMFLQDFLNISFWNPIDFSTLVLRYFLHFIVLFITVRFLYFETGRRKDYLFTYILISTIVFLLCFVLSSVDLGVGMALGLFAIFGIIRYRTGQIPIREMTYLFIVIGQAVINALANSEISLFELLFTNGIILLSVWLIERPWSLNHISQKIVHYDRIELIKPEMYQELIVDLQKRLGLTISKVEVGDVDFIRDTAKLVVYYKSLNKKSNMADDLRGYIITEN